MTNEFRDKNRFVTWAELQQEYAKRKELKRARTKKAFRVFAYTGIAATLFVLGITCHNK